MTFLLSLLHLDYLSLRAYFRRATLTKLAVITGFLVVLIGIYLTILALCLTFFYGLSFYEEFGQLTVGYIFNTALVVLFWLAIGSSLITFLGQTTKPSPVLNKLLTWGVPVKILAIWTQIKNLFVSMALIFLFVSPVQFAYNYIFSQQIILANQIKVFILSLALAGLSQAVAILLGVYLSPVLVRINRWLVFGLGSLGFVVGAGMLISLLLPSSLRRLYYSQPDEFMLLYNQLPLNSALTPSKILADNLIHGISLTGTILVLVCFTAFASSLWWLSRRFTCLIQQMQIQSRSKLTNSLLTLDKKSSLPLVRLWLISIIRDARELGYVVFFTLLVAVFYGLLSQSQLVREFELQWLPQLVLVSLVWILFISTAYSLRLVYPLAARMKKFAWMLAVQPASRNEQLFSLLLTAWILSLPLMLINLIVWISLPLSLTWTITGLFVSLILIDTLVLLSLFLGAIQPDFEHADQPELTSTSATGLVCLSWSLILVGVSSWLMYLSIVRTETLIMNLSLILLAAATSLALVSPIARYRFGKQEY